MDKNPQEVAGILPHAQIRNWRLQRSTQVLEGAHCRVPLWARDLKLLLFCCVTLFPVLFLESLYFLVCK